MIEAGRPAQYGAAAMASREPESANPAAQGGARERECWLVRHPAEWRQVGIVGVYLGLLSLMFFAPAWRHPVPFVLACLLSFLNAVVIHNHMHRGIFHSRRLNLIWRCVLSFGALYPASANVPAHNLVHHHFADDGQPDWADPSHVRFRWHLLNLIHFPNIVGPNTFAGVGRWAKVTKQQGFVRQYVTELAVAFGLTGAALLYDFWGALLFIVLPQLYGARCILRINLIQHDATDPSSEWNHSRNFVGRWFNWIMCNNGYHTIHHNRAGLHWSELAEAHRREVKPHIEPRLDEPSMILYLLRTFVLRPRRPTRRARGESEAVLRARAERRAAAEVEAAREQAGDAGPEGAAA
jgi:fatty acid desaturase